MRAAILLAAGRSQRFGSANKLLASFNGRPLVLHALAAARAAPVGRVIVVTGAQADRIARTTRLASPRARIVRARDHREGLAASLRAGLAALRPIERELFVFLGDMPAIPHGLALRLAFRLTRDRAAAIRPAWKGVVGHPVLMRRPSRATMAALRGDKGLRSDHSLLRVLDRDVIRDIDHGRDVHG